MNAGEPKTETSGDAPLTTPVVKEKTKQPEAQEQGGPRTKIALEAWNAFVDPSSELLSEARNVLGESAESFFNVLDNAKESDSGVPIVDRDVATLRIVGAVLSSEDENMPQALRDKAEIVATTAIMDVEISGGEDAEGHEIVDTYTRDKDTGEGGFSFEEWLSQTTDDPNGIRTTKVTIVPNRLPEETEEAIRYSEMSEAEISRLEKNTRDELSVVYAILKGDIKIYSNDTVNSKLIDNLKVLLPEVKNPYRLSRNEILALRARNNKILLELTAGESSQLSPEVIAKHEEANKENDVIAQEIGNFAFAGINIDGIFEEGGLLDSEEKQKQLLKVFGEVQDNVDAYREAIEASKDNMYEFEFLGRSLHMEKEKAKKVFVYGGMGIAIILMTMLSQASTLEQ